MPEEFVLTEEKATLLNVLSAFGIMKGGKNPIITPLILTTNEDCKSLDIKCTDSKQVVLISGKWTPKSLQPGTVKEITIDPETLHQAVQAMNDTTITIKIGESILEVSTPRRVARLRLEAEKIDKLSRMPEYKDFLIKINIDDASDIQSIIAAVDKIQSMPFIVSKQKISKYKFSIRDNNLHISVGDVLSKGNFDFDSDVLSTITTLKEGIPTGEYVSDIVETLFSIPNGKIEIQLGSNYLLNVKWTDNTYQAEYYVAPIVPE